MNGIVHPVKWLRKKPEVVAAVYDRRSDVNRKKFGGHRPPLQEEAFLARIVPILTRLSEGGAVTEIVRRGELISARLDFSEVKISAVPRFVRQRTPRPARAAALPLVCRDCSELEHDQTVEIKVSPAYAWRRLGLVESDGKPTRRGVVFGFFQGGEGLAIAAALEEATYPIDDLVFDLANIRAGPRFAGEDAPLGGRLGRSASVSMNGPIIRDTSRWASRCITAPARRKSFARSYPPVGSLQAHLGFVASRRCRTCADGMAQPSPAHRRRA